MNDSVYTTMMDLWRRVRKNTPNNPDWPMQFHVTTVTNTLLLATGGREKMEEFREDILEGLKELCQGHPIIWITVDRDTEDDLFILECFKDAVGVDYADALDKYRKYNMRG